ncbi:MAG: 8-oxo-dGTP diphosphatase [Melioribacteraceae bacterium]|nr:8-oxo-dGTP diphosphatase [Melioribacteraceae bacterium]MCF8263848.1 8-oxo-dGTP diphosphatase [Melioribacteraceae bacterium]MCF8413255.1 8-oxo-dGTP diphosphatase [Melioribacteraceae bacterium]
MILATLVYLQQKGKTLMLLRNKKQNDFHKGKWNGLGGKMEPGESPDECAIREVEEESGYKIQNLKLAGLITEPLFDGKQDWHLFLYTSEDFEGEQIISDEGTLEWIPNEKIFDLNLWEGDRIFLKWILEKKFFSAKFIYKKKEFKDYSVNFYE